MFNLNEKCVAHPTGLPPESEPVGRFPQQKKAVLYVLSVL